MTDPLVLLLVQLGALLIAALTLGQIAQRLGVPAIVGELAAGIVLGPSVLGALAPLVHGTLFPLPDPVRGPREYILKLGLLIFLFLIGQEAQLGGVGRGLARVAVPSLLGILLPFGLVSGALLLAPGFWMQPGGDPMRTSIGAGLATCFSSLPFLARALTDLGLVRSPLGGLVLSVAVIDDALGNLGLAMLTSLASGSAAASRSLWQTAALVVALFALIATLGRRVGRLLGAWVERRPGRSDAIIGWSGVVVLLAAASTQLLGISDIFGALMAGLALSSVSERVFAPLRLVARYFFTPLVFASQGLGANFVQSFHLPLVLAVILLACGGKMIGVTLGAKLVRFRWREALALASGMNARGPVDIVAAAILLQAALITEQLFVACVVMVLVSGLFAGTLMQRILRVAPPATLVRARAPVLQRLDPYGRPVEEIPVGSRLTIGRHPSNQLALTADELVSLYHVIIREAGGQFRIEDLGSTNGTLLWRDARWQAVTLDELRDGDIFLVGASVFRFSTGAQEG